MQLITLRNDVLQADVLPAVAGGLSRLDWIKGGSHRAVLRAAALGEGMPMPTTSQMACFPMLPWCNRVGGGGFPFGGRFVALAPNRAGEPYPIHGDGWQHPWAVAQQSPDALTLTLDRSQGKPFAYHAQLIYRLIGSSLQVELTVRNAGALALPFGLGLHPWLPRDASVRLRAPVRSTWRIGSDGLPDVPMPLPAHWDFSDWQALPAEHTDQIFAGWNGQADIRWGELQLSIKADMRYLILYAPAGRDVFCVEPLSHAINGHNLAGGPEGNGLVVLEPGDTLTRHIAFDVGCDK
jgi:aldose 1-epimerase